MNYITYKILGSLILIISAIAFGLKKIKSERAKLKEITAFADMIKFIQNNIEHYNKPLPDIFAEYHNDHLSELLDRIRTSGINKAVANYSFNIAASISEKIICFANKIGSGYTDDELSLCQYTYKSLLESETKMRIEIRNTEKMYLTIPVLLALSVILILI